MRILRKKNAKLKHALRISLALLSIPLIAWFAEYVFTHYLFTRRLKNSTQHMILSNHGYEGYDYAQLNSLLRKIRRLEMQLDRDAHGFRHNSEHAGHIARLIKALENEKKLFSGYYYETLDLYAQTEMPAKTRRRMHYYRSIIKQAIGRTKQLQELVQVS